MNTDPIADLLTRIRNAFKAKKEYVIIPFSKVKWGIVKIFEENNFITAVKLVQKEQKRDIKIILPKDRESLSLKRISKPGRRVYKKCEELRPALQGYGIFVVSTSKGMMTEGEAKKQNLGGEVICEIF